MSYCEFKTSLDTLTRVLNWSGDIDLLQSTNFNNYDPIEVEKPDRSSITILSQGTKVAYVELPDYVLLHTWTSDEPNRAVFFRAEKYLETVFANYVELVEMDIKPRIPYAAWRDLQRINTCIRNAGGFVSIYNFDSNLTFHYGEKLDTRIDISKNNLPGDFVTFVMRSLCSIAPPWNQRAKPQVRFDTENNNNNIKKEKENKTMNMKMPAMNFEFGPCGNDVALSPYGVAIRNGDQWLTYNPSANKTVDVTGFSFDFQGMLMKMPAPLGDVRPGDVVMHQGNPMFVTNVDNNSIYAVDIKASEAKTIVPVTNMFGFNYVTKIVSFINMNGMGAPSPDQPFGNIMPMIFMSQMFNGEDNGGFFGNEGQGNMLCQMAQMSFMASMMTNMGQGNPFGNMFNFNLGGTQENKEG